MFNRGGGKRGIAIGAAATALLVVAGCDLGDAPTTYPGVGNRTLTGDFNDDGHLDVLTRFDADGAHVLFGDGTGELTAGTLSAEWTNTPAAVGDANGDGYDDLFASYATQPPPCELPPEYCPPPQPQPVYVYVALNQAGAGFGAFTVIHTAMASQPSGFYPYTWGVDDVNGDGVVDLLFTQPEPTQQTVVRLADGTGGYGAPVASPSHLYPVGEQQSGDVDGDGHPDLVIGGLGGTSPLRGTVSILWGNGTASFDPVTVLPSIDWGPSSNMSGVRVVELGDYDGDGDVDIASVDHDLTSGNEDFAIFLNQGNRTFAPLLRIPSGTGPLSTVYRTGDFDGDGLDDLVNSDKFILFGEPGVQFSDGHYVASDGAIDRVADFDADGRPDLLVATSDGVQVFMNRWDGRPS